MAILNVHSIETMSGQDGPGVRCVVFLQGCPLRCKYCHNPDTWPLTGGSEFSPHQLFDTIRKYKPYFKNRGGVTFTGGEPLLQARTLVPLLELCQEADIHTAIDTSGVVLNENVERCVELADLILLDIKHMDAGEFNRLTGGLIDNVWRFMKLLERHNKPTWIRQVIVPGWNDREQDLNPLADFLADKKFVEKVELLGYHKLADAKYIELDITPPLPDVPEMDATRLAELQAYLDKKLAAAKSKN